MIFIDPVFGRELPPSGSPGLLTRTGVRGLRELLDESNDEVAEIERAGDVSVEFVENRGIPLVVVHPRATSPRGLLFVVHGGGLVAGGPTFRLAELCRQVRRHSLRLVIPDYRLAPEHPYPAALEDVREAWLWANRVRAATPGPRVVWGGSAGGMLAATLALRAGRDHLPPLDALMLLQPMLDDRPTAPADPTLHGRGLWDHESNRRAWELYLAGAGQPTADMVPARAVSLASLPPLYIEAAQADVLRTEALEFAERATRDGISTELHLWPGAIHGFEGTPEASVSQAAWTTRIAYLDRVLSTQD